MDNKFKTAYTMASQKTATVERREQAIKATIIEPQYCLTEVNHNDIKLTNEKSRKAVDKKLNSVSKENENTVRKL